MKKRFFSVLLILSALLLFPAPSASSLIPGFDVSNNQSAEYQTFYLVGLCATNITKAGNIVENAEMMRAVCRQVLLPTKETIALDCENSKLSLRIEIAFDSRIRLQFSSEYIEIESVLPYFQAVTGFHESADFLYLIDAQQTIHSILMEDLLPLFDHIPTRNATLTLASPYASDLFEDVELVLFDTYGETQLPLMDDGSTLYIGIGQDGIIQLSLPEDWQTREEKP